MIDRRLAKHRGKFCAVWYENGKRKRHSLGTNDKDLAKRRIAEFTEPERRNEDGWIYVFRCESADGFVKIGFASDVDHRLHGVTVGCPYPVTLVGAMQGTREDERRIHAMLSNARVRGEWFRPLEAVNDFVKTVPKYKRPRYIIEIRPDDDLGPVLTQFQLVRAYHSPER